MAVSGHQIRVRVIYVVLFLLLVAAVSAAWLAQLAAR